MHPKQIKSFHGLRAVLVIFLFLHHLDMFYDLNISGYAELMKFFAEGAVSVDFFFILSGFVVTYGYLPKLRDGSVTSSVFLINRISKIYPMHLLLWITCAVVYSGTGYLLQNLSSSEFWFGAFLLQSYVPISGYAFWGNGVSWSVSTQLFFYAAFPVLVRLSRKERKAIFGALFLVILLNSIVIGNASPVSQWFYNINPVFRLLDFLGGMLLCEWMQQMKWRPQNTKSASILEISSVAVLLWFMVISADSGFFMNPRFQSYYYLLPCLFLLFAFYFEQGILSRLFKTKPLQRMGEASFAFYLVHQLILYLVKNIWGMRITNIHQMLLFSLIALFFSEGAAFVLHYFFEKPVNQALRKFYNKRKAV